jgi:hypothetical protein
MVVVVPRQETNDTPKALPSMTVEQIDEALTRFVLQNTADLHQEAAEVKPPGYGSSDPESAARQPQTSTPSFSELPTPRWAGRHDRRSSTAA